MLCCFLVWTWTSQYVSKVILTGGLVIRLQKSRLRSMSLMKRRWLMCSLIWYVVCFIIGMTKIRVGLGWAETTLRFKDVLCIEKYTLANRDVLHPLFCLMIYMCWCRKSWLAITITWTNRLKMHIDLTY